MCKVHELKSSISRCDDATDESFAYSRIDALCKHLNFESWMIPDDLERLLDPHLDPRDCECTILAKDTEGHHRHVRRHDHHRKRSLWSCVVGDATGKHTVFRGQES